MKVPSLQGKVVSCKSLWEPQIAVCLLSWWPAQEIYELVTLGFDVDKTGTLCVEYFEKFL